MLNLDPLILSQAYWILIQIKQVAVKDVEYGENVKVFPCNLYRCQLDDDVFIGHFVKFRKMYALVSGQVRSTFICSLVKLERLLHRTRCDVY